MSDKPANCVGDEGGRRIGSLVKLKRAVQREFHHLCRKGDRASETQERDDLLPIDFGKAAEAIYAGDELELAVQSDAKRRTETALRKRTSLML